MSLTINTDPMHRLIINNKTVYYYPGNTTLDLVPSDIWNIILNYINSLDTLAVGLINGNYPGYVIVDKKYADRILFALKSGHNIIALCNISGSDNIIGGQDFIPMLHYRIMRAQPTTIGQPVKLCTHNHGTDHISKHIDNIEIFNTFLNSYCKYAFYIKCKLVPF